MTGGLRVVVLPDKFRGSLTGEEVASAVSRAMRRLDPSLDVLAMPLTDGGQGTLRILAEHRGAVLHRSEVTGPYGDPVPARWAALPDGTAVIEAADVCGWSRAGTGLRPLQSTTRGVGELIGIACHMGHERIIVTIGDTVTVDGGLGAIEALSWSPVRAEVRVAGDVDILFTDAVRHFARQKGATDEEIPRLSAQLERLGERYRDVTGRDADAVRCGGSGGGLAGALAVFGARCAPGFTVMSELLGLDDPLSRADIVVTGEGRFDRTSLLGKGTYRLLTGRGEKVRGGLIAGSVDRHAAGALRPGTVVVPFTDYRPGTAEAIRDAGSILDEAAADLATALLHSPRARNP
ncbi:glycerate kinase [Nonomuraea turkmeniaca]|uniref:Glycerate kinase n=1 Tax=Nonomuraea turkmeniaca TaxID=103838 RepID=A0A5S4FZW7_9ACTN|nr:glycerate kinase [Nonomuraea turkmeniaca]TMR25661.1 glycerate kinase [Nonomuraea turkmeniaca]